MITVKVDVKKNHLPALAGMDWRMVHARIGAYFTREMGEMFATAGASRGHKWQELATSTLLQKTRSGASTEILQGKRGLLRASFRPLRLSSEALVFGTDLSYAKYHDSDLPRKQKAAGGPRLPQRKLLRLTQGDREEIPRIVTGALLEAARGQGGGA